MATPDHPLQRQDDAAISGARITWTCARRAKTYPACCGLTGGKPIQNNFATGASAGPDAPGVRHGKVLKSRGYSTAARSL